MQIKFDYWENMISRFTNSLYEDAIAMSCSAGNIVPLVGHNAFLRWSAIKSISWPDVTDHNRVKFWSESNVSEDFHLSLKLQAAGYRARYIMYTGPEFREGVSLTSHDELVKLRKFAYGASELMFNPIKDWACKGLLTPEWKHFLTFRQISWSAKAGLIGYLFTWFAIAWSGPGVVITYFLWVYFPFYRDNYLDGWSINLYVIVVFIVLGPIANVVLKYRLGQRGVFRGLYEEYIYAFITSIFWSSLGWHLSTAILSHLLNLNIVWGATVKEVTNTNFFIEINLVWKRYGWLYGVCFVVLAAVFALIFIPQLGVQQHAIDLRALYVIIWVTGCHMLGPLILNPTLMRIQC